jgi:hypothetical protein
MMVDARLARSAGAVAVIGGAAWVVAIILHSLQPRGCIGDECLDRPMREGTAATSWLMLLAAAALVAFLVALLALLGRSGNLGWTGIAGLVLCVLGLGGLALATLPQVRDQWRPLPMMVAIAVGLALLAWTVLRSGLMPTWAAVALLIGFLLLGGVSEQTARVLLALPFGMAWLVTGIAMIQRSRTDPSALPDRVEQTSDGSGEMSPP